MSKKTQKKKLTQDLKEKIRTEFVQGIDEENGQRKTFTLDELITKHNVAKSTLYRVANKDNWRLEKERFQQEYLLTIDRQRIKNLAEESKRFDNTSLTLARALIQTIGANIRKNTEDMNAGKKSLQPTQVNALANAALSTQKLAKIALGETTEKVELNGNITEETAFREAMELLDEVARGKQQADDSAVH
mgnify:CR=1 FL=1|tara:strand:- start:827 stop:1396 length:570 start_codon:yes stop_codon:yes gene_type:complete